MDQENDVWAESDEEQQVIYERNLAEKEWEKLQEDHGNSGYKEGVVEGKEVNMQRGFDKGYKEGLFIGKSLGQIRGKISSQLVFFKQILKNEQAAQELETLLEEIDKIEVNTIFSVDYFRKEGPKDTTYKSPEDFIKDLQAKVDGQLSSLAKRY